MSASLLELLPDLVCLLRRDGSVISQIGGNGVPDLKRVVIDGAGWSEASAALIKQLLRRCIAHRTAVEGHLQEQGRDYDVRLVPQGPNRAFCIVRAMLPGSRDEANDASGLHLRPELDRRGFLRRFRESMSLAVLREQLLAVAVLYIDGLPDIAQVIGTRVSEHLMATAILRLMGRPDANGSDVNWYVGQLGEHVLAIVMHTSDRNAIESCVSQACTRLREPISVEGTEFRLTPYAGVKVLGIDATTPKSLLDQARAAAMEARRAASNSVQFYTDTMRLHALARFDMARELRAAIASRHIGFRYIGRYDLMTGRVQAWTGYLRWQHPLRGEIRPAEFLRIAESTGLGVALSRAALKSLCEDFVALSPQWEPDVRISFGALRDHIFHEDFIADLELMFVEQALPAERFELRLAEKTFVTRDPRDFRSLQKRSVQLVVDEVGRNMSSLALLARAPLWGLQLDRAWVTAISNDEVAHKVCRAGIGMATAIGLTPIATGVDQPQQRDALLAMGCRYGSGDLYAQHSSNISESCVG
jgi:EAL domain-containing protein (putative c-di-GMP-specific phosphodiesterase class I)/GGDEF domain-containing protein